MKKLITNIILSLTLMPLFAQSITRQIEKAWGQFENDPQLKHAISSLYIIDAVTGKVVFDKNSGTGLAPASTQKIITAAAAFELLGKEYRYKTFFYINRDNGKSSLHIRPSGDPTLGSWRWPQTKEEQTLRRIIAAVKNTKISLSWPIVIDGYGWNSGSIPDGWTWQDIGNYYGAGAELLNWRENQFDIILKSGNAIGDTVEIVGTTPALLSYKLASLATAAGKASGDNAYVYFPLHGGEGTVRGTIPVNEKNFTISASLPSAKTEFEQVLADSLRPVYEKPTTPSAVTTFYKGDKTGQLIHTETSPPLDSIIYWFLKKSINLYGEALIKTIAYEQKGSGVTDTGISAVKYFWKQRNITADELNLYDGSGLSPLNRVTTHAQVEVLKYAAKQNWFGHFYDAFPEYNGMKLKSGTISDVKAFCGYHQSKGGNKYILSFIVNNYSGSPATLVAKMYRVLDILK